MDAIGTTFHPAEATSTQRCPEADGDALKNMNRRQFLSMVAGLPLGRTAQLSAMPVAQASARPFELGEASIDQLQDAMRNGSQTAVSLVGAYLDRVTDVDRGGPALRAVIEVNPGALEAARRLDRERSAGHTRGPLHGIPILLKDNIDTGDRMMTTAGSLALDGSHAPRDAFLVGRLRAAGAVILGKTNLSEWANFRSNRSTSGWSGRGGQTRNPYVLARNPSGSSSGSAVAVSASLCAVAVGTETDGSIVSPCSVNGIVGIKPTVGLISRSGIIPISKSQDTAGPMARSVTDAAILLGAMTGIDVSDDATRASDGQSHPDYRRFLDAGGLRGARIGVARQFFPARAEVAKVFESAIDALRKAGATVIDPTDLPSFRMLGGAEYQVLLYEFKAGLNAYLEALGPAAPVRSLADVIRFNDRHREQEMPWFGQETLLLSQEKGPLTEEAYLDALDNCRRHSRAEGLDAVFTRHDLTAIVAPTAGPAHVTDHVYGDRDTGGSSSPAAVSGYPSITVPAGDVFGLPVGLSFIGRPFGEPTLIKLAFAFEQITAARIAPRFRPS